MTFYVFLCFMRIDRALVEQVFLFRFLTNLQLFLVALVLTLVCFKRTRLFCLKYLLLPALNLAWLVMIMRFSFDMISGIEWNLLFEQKHPSGAPQHLREIYDLAVHFMPFFVLLRIHAFMRSSFISQQRSLSYTGIIWNVFGAYVLMMLWNLFFDPFDTYLIPKNIWSMCFIYGGNFVLLFFTSVLLSPPLAYKFNIKTTRRRVPALGLLVTFFIILLLVDLYGISILFRFPIAASCFLISIFYIGCLMKEKWAAYLMLPIYAFSFSSFMILKVLFTHLEDYNYFLKGLDNPALFSHFSFAVGFFAVIILPLLSLTVNDYLMNTYLRRSFIAHVFHKKRNSQWFSALNATGAVQLTFILIIIDNFTSFNYLMYDISEFSSGIMIVTTVIVSYFLVVRSWPVMHSYGYSAAAMKKSDVNEREKLDYN